MAGFQLAGPAADVSKILYGENRKSYQSPNAQYNNSGAPKGEAAKCSKIRAHAHILEDILGYFVHLLHQSDIL